MKLPRSTGISEIQILPWVYDNTLDCLSLPKIVHPIANFETMLTKSVNQTNVATFKGWDID